jgi:hypothetical protein
MDAYSKSIWMNQEQPSGLKEKLFEQNRNVFETLLFQEKNALNDNQIIGIVTILIFDEGIFQSKSFSSVSDIFSFKTCPFEKLFINLPQLSISDIREEHLDAK